MFGLMTKNSGSYAVLIDIGSGSVGVAVVLSMRGELLPHILFAHRVYIHVSKRGDKKTDYARQIREALFSACLILSKDGLQALRTQNPKGKIAKIILTCSSPWSVTVARNVNYTNEEAFRVTESLIHDLESSAEHEIETVTDQSGVVNALGYEIVERITVDVRINDYIVDTPFGLKGTQIDLSHITGLISRELLDSVREIQEKIFTDVPIQAHTFMLVNYCVLRELFSESQNHVLVNITAEGTEFGIVERGALIETIYAPMGVYSLIRAIAHDTNKVPADIISQLRAYTRNELTDTARIEADAYLERYRAVMRDTFTTIQNKRALPSLFIVTAQPQFEDIFIQTFSALLHDCVSKSAKAIAVPNDILCELPLNSDQPDVFMTISGRFFHKLHSCGELNDV